MRVDKTRPVEEFKEYVHAVNDSDVKSGRRCAIYTSTQVHPTRPELIYTGDDQGVVSIWDRRKGNLPLWQQAQHQAWIRQIRLDTSRPKSLYTASDDGRILYWTLSSIPTDMYDTSPQVNIRPLVSTVLPWNAVDLHSHSKTSCRRSRNRCQKC